MGGLTDRLREHWPPQRMVVTCEVCGAELWDSKKEDLRGAVQNSAPYVASWVNMEMATHREDSGHGEFDVRLDVPPSPDREIDVEITVNNG